MRYRTEHSRAAELFVTERVASNALRSVGYPDWGVPGYNSHPDNKTSKGCSVMLPAFDIFKKQDGALVWVEPAQDLETARKRVEQLFKLRRGEYIIFDHTQQQVVASLNPSAH